MKFMDFSVPQRNMAMQNVIKASYMIEWLTDYMSKRVLWTGEAWQVQVCLWSFKEAGFRKDCLGHEGPRGFELFI